MILQFFQDALPAGQVKEMKSHKGDQNAKKETGHDPVLARLKTADKLETQSTHIHSPNTSSVAPT